MFLICERERTGIMKQRVEKFHPLTTRAIDGACNIVKPPTAGMEEEGKRDQIMVGVDRHAAETRTEMLQPQVFQEPDNGGVKEMTVCRQGTAWGNRRIVVNWTW